MANSTLDDVLSMIDTGDGNSSGGGGSTPPPRKSSTQSLRDKMLAESQQQQQQRQPVEQVDENAVEQELLDEEYEEENKPAVNIKIVIGVVVLAVLILIIIIMQVLKGKNKEVEEPVVEEEPIIEEVYTEPVVDEGFSIAAVTYSDDQISDLRNAGATTDQITAWQENGTPYEYVYYSMLENYYAFQLQNTLPTYDLTSDEYKETISDTWVALDKRTDVAEWSSDDYIAYTYEVTQNLDYEKIEPYGSQLFLKVYLDAQTHDEWFFLNITPMEWNQLDDTGNVVVNYTYCTHYLPYESKFDAVEDTENIFITDATLDIIQSLANQKNNASSTTTQ
jgi:hypothetical protein